ncbi:MAG TPA: type II toxin-antitoxin system CcdA family antitoxin [Acidimicrobiales bacterium]|nr:type II toxin-antitoxin system CcdA family antitoxin [Acidimicrobiales bacterium]
MARVNVYLPDDLAEEAREAGLNVSSIAQDALRRELAGRRTTAWLDTVRKLPRTGVTHDEVIAALGEVRAEAGDEWPARAAKPKGRSA